MRRRMTVGEKAAMVAAGAAGGAMLHAHAARAETLAVQEARTSPEEFHSFRNLPHGRTLGKVLVVGSMFLPESAARYVMGGAGVGMAAHDEWLHAQLGFSGRKINLAGVEDDLVLRWSKWIHIDPSLPVSAKEAQILPLFPMTVMEQRGNPLQQRAIRAFRWEVGLPEDRLSMSDVRKCQEWILRNGRYTANEGKFQGHDRFRTLAKLLRERHRYGRAEYDCDDWGISFGQVVDSYGYDPGWVLISQKDVPPGEDTHPLHHILPTVRSGGKTWLVEGIRRAPVVPLEAISMLFGHLTRVVTLGLSGSPVEYYGFREPQRLVANGLR